MIVGKIFYFLKIMWNKSNLNIQVFILIKKKFQKFKSLKNEIKEIKILI
jgi:hypothetical protein